VQTVWREVRGALEDKLRSYTLAQFAAKSLDEMSYI
jgi:DNA-binding IscR family transcriptional regulator